MSGLNYKKIGKKIRERRLSLGITQETIANQLDVNPSHISNIECGRANPSLTALIKIANSLHCSVDYFINEEYSFTMGEEQDKNLEQQIIDKIRRCNTEKLEKLLKIIDIL